MDHIPVLQHEVLQHLDPKPDENIIDGTVGNGGHASLLLEKTAPFGKLLAIDADKQQITNARHALEKYNERIVLVNGSYANIKEIAERVRFKPIHGILLDLGYSSWHVDQSGRGFSFSKNEPLDMRYGLAGLSLQGQDAGKVELTAERIVNEYKEKELAHIFAEYGEEKFSKQIARAIVGHRKVKKISTTFDLVKVIEEAVGMKYRGQNIHYATRTFQALRIVVNGELENLEKALPEALEILASGGRMAIISFHSLEDRIVKHFFQQKEKEGVITILTNKPVTASDQEVISNLRARSAKLRAIQKI